MSGLAPQAVIPVVTFTTPLASNSEDVRPSQTPHLTMSSRIGPASLGPKEAVPRFRFRGIIRVGVRRPGRPPKEPFPDPSRPARGDPLAAGAARAIHRQPTGWGWDPVPSPQSQSFSRLRIHFADFPCLHCSIDQRLSPWRRCGYEYGRAWAAFGPPDFQGPPGRTGHHAASRCSSGRWTLPPVSRFEGGRC
ncbi:hypothetical protein H5410_064021 [Solanum commersonii]|uniref:Uncharacterized protein n=1 Tax=Solanum commersonii TaxID=4109 RepID=A0A9J5W0N6_SOLCO|nr:hypothetical protein H5410_064021 [Solanum commersonii]